MVRTVLLLALLLLTGLFSIRLVEAAPNKINADQEEAKAAVRHLLDTYVQSIINADTKLGATVWSTTHGVSFIEPRGSEQGWDQIADLFYTKTMGAMFTKRTLKAVGDVNIQMYGSAAVVTFNWDFVAVMRSNAQTIHTTGRETQVYADLPGKGWRLVHVHSSGPPIGAPSQGF
jgi:hypothetical protein